ncbi:MAG: ABC transporter substrate-binding protein [Candidatus Krumholzibacteriia bacterium]
MRRPFRHGRCLSRIPPVAVLLAAALISGCAGGGRRSGSDQEPLAGTRMEQAERHAEDARRQFALGEFGKVLDQVGTLLDYYPEYPGNGEALGLAVASAQRLGNPERALSLARELRDLYPGSGDLEPTLDRAARFALAGRDTLSAISFLRMSPTAVTTAGGSGRGELLRYLEEKAPGDGGPAAPAVGGREGVDSAGDTPGPIDSRRIGLLAPLTGRYAVLGNAFYEAARLALGHVERDLGREFVLKVADTGGDPVQGALAARKLCAEDKCLALVGALTSGPTVSAALVADQLGVPFVSPTATNERIRELGPGVFQPNLTGDHEIRLLSTLAVDVLLKRRFAILAPESPEGRRQADLFAQEVSSRGAEVVARGFFPPQVTDFRAEILDLKKHRPEVVFVPVSADQMVLVGPQLDFYQLGALVLGPGAWNDARLIERTSGTLERAVFPDDLAWFPASWTADFQQEWDAENFPGEAEAVALWAYQAVRNLLETIVEEGITGRADLIESFGRKFSGSPDPESGFEMMAEKIRVVEDGVIKPFPAGRFAAGLAAAAPADSLGSAGTDSLAGFAGPGDR